MHMHTITPPITRAQPLPQHLGALRVTGSLTCDARLDMSTGGHTPHQLLSLQFAPQRGLPYLARVDLGDDPTDHMAAEALLPHLRAGATVSVAAQALELRTDHSHAALRLVQPHSVMLFQQPLPTVAATPAPETTPQEPAHAPA